MPQVTIKAGFTAADGGEEQLTEYLCDQTGCPNVATHVLGCAKESAFVPQFVKSTHQSSGPETAFSIRRCRNSS